MSSMIYHHSSWKVTVGRDWLDMCKRRVSKKAEKFLVAGA
jgi:hypothetical protein